MTGVNKNDYQKCTENTIYHLYERKSDGKLKISYKSEMGIHG